MNRKELAKYRGCTGLPTDWQAWKRAIPYEPGEIDYEQPAVEMIRLVPETAEFLYSEYSPTLTRYQPGTRPKMERIVDLALSRAKTDRDKVVTLLDWTWRMVSHCYRVRTERVVVGGTEEDILERGFGYCNELSRVFVTLCQVAGLRARMTFHWTADSRFGHSCAETFFDGKWQLCDATFNIHGSSVPRQNASCWDLMRSKEVRRAFDRRVPARILHQAGVTAKDVTYSDFFHVIGICNYPVENFPYKLRAMASEGSYLDRKEREPRA